MMTKIIHTIFIFASLLIIHACEPEKKINNKDEVDFENKTAVLKQSKESLLSGVSKAICYSGFRTGQHPDRGDGAVNPSADEILEDLTILHTLGFKLIRLYDSGENTEAILELIREKKLDIKVMLGIWLQAELSNHETCEWLIEPIPQDELDANKIQNAEEIQRGIKLANEYSDLVIAVNVGNEALVDWNDHKVDLDTIISYCKKVKRAVGQPITVAENYEWWATKGKKLAEVLDFIAVHIYPVWEGKDIDEGLSYSIENIQKVRNTLPESILVISEAGWASVASEFGERASEVKQERYYHELMNWSNEMNITTFWFEAFDEDWKGNPNDPLGAEKNWGLFTVDRKPKKVMNLSYKN